MIFLKPPILPKLNSFSIDASVLEKMIERSIIISAAGDEKRAHINGVFIERLHAMTTDLRSCVLFLQTAVGLIRLSFNILPRSLFLTGKGCWFPRKG
jgi:hypothetical protein